MLAPWGPGPGPHRCKRVLRFHSVPTEFQGTVMGDLSRRKGMIVNSDQEAEDCVIEAHVPLNNMFGYSTALRTLTQARQDPSCRRFLPWPNW